MHSLLADLILLLHFGYVSFVVVGFAAIWVGFFCRWRWVRHPFFRSAHLLSMAVVALEAVSGVDCPFTTWENSLRVRAGGGVAYQESFLQHWLHRVLFFEFPESAFVVTYVVFFALVVLSLWLVPPRWRARKQ